MNNKSFVVFTLLCAIIGSASGQDSRSTIDSLNSLLRESTRSERVLLLCELSSRHMKEDSEKALYYASAALNISSAEKKYADMARSTRLAAKAHKEMGCQYFLLGNTIEERRNGSPASGNDGWNVK